MGISTQFVLRSTDGGRSWRASPILDPAQLACGEAALVATSGSSRAARYPLSAYPVQRTTDTGSSWRNLSMPVPVPAGSRAPLDTLPVNALSVFAPDGITVLPDGALLLTGQQYGSGGWQLLRPGRHRWCAVVGFRQTWQSAQQASVITRIGSDLWWLTWGGASAGRPAPIGVHELPLTSVRCA